MSTIFHDVRYAARSLRGNPGFAVVAAVTAALGIGATTSIFCVLNAVLLRPLPYPQSQRLVWLAERGAEWSGGPLSLPNYQDWHDGQDVFEQFGVFNHTGFTLTGSGEPVQLAGAQISAEAIGALKVAAHAGRLFTADEDAPGATPVVLISSNLWRTRFAADAAVVGRAITLDAKPYTVVGVMPAGFAFPGPVDVWVPLRPAADAGWQNRGNHPGLFGVARLKPGVTLERARATIDAVAARLEQAYPESNKGRGAVVEPLIHREVGGASRALWTLGGAVALVLLIACANVANLMLARAAARQKELAVRVALGAGRWRIVRQLLAESVLLAAVGAAAGVLLAHWAVALILAVAGDSIPRAAEVRVDGAVLAFSAAAAVLTGILFGLAPAWQASRPAAGGGLGDAGRGASPRRARLRAALTVGELALTLLLLVGAGLLLRSFNRLRRVDPGYAYDRVLCFRVQLPDRRYGRMEERVLFYERLLEGLRAVPGVQRASVASQLPLDGNNWDTAFLVEGEPEPPPHLRPAMEVHIVGPDYFETMDIPVVAGRAFDHRDDRSHLRGTGREGDWAAGFQSVVIDQEFARRHFPGRDPVGRRIRLTWDTDVVLTVVGVVGRVREEKLSEQGGRVQAYLPFLQAPGGGMAVVVRTTSPPESIFPAARAQVTVIDPQLPVFDVDTLAGMRDASLGSHRANLVLLGTFAGLAVLLAVVGLYGVLAYTVTQRRREIGVRMALGAQRRQVLAMVAGEGMRLAAAGAALGVIASAAAARVLRGFLYEVAPLDPLTLVSVTAALGLVALLAAVVPARRAASLEPLAALRHE